MAISLEEGYAMKCPKCNKELTTGLMLWRDNAKEQNYFCEDCLIGIKVIYYDEFEKKLDESGVSTNE